MSPRDQRARWLVAALVIGVVLCGAGASLWITSLSLRTLRPTDPAEVDARHPPLEHRAGRRLDPRRCGLNQEPVDGGCRDVADADARDEEVVFPVRRAAKGVTHLQGTLSIPEGRTLPRPGVVIVHGSGPSTRDGASPGDLIARYEAPFLVYRALGDALTRQGLAVLRYDKRTSAPYRDAFDITTFAFSDFVDDAKDALDYLASRPEIDGDALIVVGHSQGGQLAPHIAHDDPRVRAVVLLAGSTETFGALVIGQLERIRATRRRQGDPMSAALLWMNVWSARACIEPVWRGTHTPGAQCLGGGVTQQALADYEALGRRTRGLLADLDAPVLAMQGAVDLNIDPDEIPRMTAVLAGRDAELYRLAGLDHSFTDALAPSTPITLAPSAVERLRAFLASVPWRDRE